MCKVILAAAVAAVFGPGMARCETYTMETYYPAPVGVYTNMTVTSTTVLARDGGSVTIGTSKHNSNLSVTGVVVPGKFESDPAAPAQKIEGAIYFNTTLKKHRVFKSGAWEDLGGGGEVLIAGVDPCNAANDGKKALRYDPGGTSFASMGADGIPIAPAYAPGSLTRVTCKYAFVPYPIGPNGVMSWVWR